MVILTYLPLVSWGFFVQELHCMKAIAKGDGQVQGKHLSSQQLRVC